MGRVFLLAIEIIILDIASGTITEFAMTIKVIY
jgi:hypothetical protein